MAKASDFMTRRIYDEEEKPKPRIGVDEVMSRPLSRVKDPNRIGLALTGAKTTGQDVDKLMPAGFQIAGTQARKELDYQESTAAKLRGRSRTNNFMDDLLQRGTDPNVAAKLTTDRSTKLELADIMGTKQPDEQFISTKGGVFSTKDRKIVEGTEQGGAAGGHLTDYQGPRVRFEDGSVGTWNGKRYAVTAPRLVNTSVRDDEGMWYSEQQPESVEGLPLYGAGAEGQPVDDATAQAFLEQAGGDPNKARELARKAGYTF